ncbi:hypothetical protein OH77DRAFT_1417942 [Trametes cingulata]|nr:hypothetical protein OH77DRAFT_1417942 [Trametes cingulata]
MAGRRLTISALLCADEQPPDRPQPPPASSHSPPSASFISPTPRPDAASGNRRDTQVQSPGPVESKRDAFRSRPYPDYSPDSHNVLPLSLQSVHLRRHTPSPSSGDEVIAHRGQWRGHGDNVLDHPETLASTSRPQSSPVSRERDFASYHIPPLLPQTAPPPTFRRRSDPREEGRRAFEGSSYFSRPVSSRSAQSDPLLASYTYPPPLPPQANSPTPTQVSPPLHSSQTARNPPQSPSLGRQASLSPTNLYRHMSQPAPYGELQQSSYLQYSPLPTHSPPIPSSSGSPTLQAGEPSTAPSSNMRSASLTQPGSPPSQLPRTSSATSLSNLLAPGPPRSPAVSFQSHGSPGGLGALEALVQAATEERRRLSGELPTPLERQETARRASLSPVLNRIPPPLPPPSHSPVSQKSPPLPSPRLDARVSSLAFISLGQPVSHDGEPPTKRRRRTGSFSTGTSILPGPVPPASLPIPPSAPSPRPPASVPALSPTSPQVLSAPSASEPRPAHAPGTSPGNIAVAPPETAPSATRVVTPASPPVALPPLPPPSPAQTPSKPRSISQLLVDEPSSSSHPNVVHEPSPVHCASSVQDVAAVSAVVPVEAELPRPQAKEVERRPTPTRIVEQPEALPVAVKTEELVKEEIPDASLVPLVADEPEPEVTQHSEVLPQADTAAHIPSEQDADEWLMEQFATDSPANASRHLSPAPELPPDSPDSAGSPPPEVKAAKVQAASPSSPRSPAETKSRHRKTRERSRTPTPLALLEEELDRVTPDDRSVPSVAVSPSSDADIAMELDLAASASVPSAAKGDVAMNSELDDELLSLVDDQPRQSHSYSHPHHQPHAHHSKPSRASSSSVRPDQSQVKEPIERKSPEIPAPAPAPGSTTPAPSERVAMPPPLAPPAQSAKATATDQQQSTAKQQKAEGTSASSSMKKKDSSAKKAKQPPKPKPKATSAATKSKAKATKDSATASSGRLTPSGSGSGTKGKKTTAANALSASAAKRSVSAAVEQSRSRSASVMPAPAEPSSKAQEVEEEEEEVVDDKLYCICKTSYDEDKVMIACDRCDEWYHTQCLKMNDLEVDLIDQFVCPPCIKANPHLPLKTTYKQRCFAGLKHPRPSSAAACHKPARGAFSKFCSDECGITYMQRRIDGWGGDQTILWASVKDVKQREGVVVKVHVVQEEPKRAVKPEQQRTVPGQLVMENHEVQRPTKTQRERAVTRLQAELLKIAPKREALKQELEVILWRQRLLELATARAERVEECGWDQRLCFDEDEYAEYAAGVLDSYEEGHADAMQVDGTGVEEGAWWCRGKKKCQRHSGWQKLRATEIEFDLELKEKAMAALTTQEREIRRQLEDVISLESRRTVVPLPNVPPQPLNGNGQVNGATKPKANGTSHKKGKQKN